MSAFCMSMFVNNNILRYAKSLEPFVYVGNVTPSDSRLPT